MLVPKLREVDVGRPMSKDKREACARRLCELDGVQADKIVSGTLRDGLTAWEAHLPYVDAILAELRVPSETMSAAGVATFEGDERPSGQPLKSHQAMIDAVGE